MKLRKCEISGKVIYSKRIVLLVRQKTLNRHYHTHKTNSKFLRRKSNISEKKKERGCTFFTVQHLWSVLTFFSIADFICSQCSSTIENLTSLFHPPYLQCARGHVVCSDCRPNVSTCPQVSIYICFYLLDVIIFYVLVADF